MGDFFAKNWVTIMAFTFNAGIIVASLWNLKAAVDRLERTTWKRIDEHSTFLKAHGECLAEIRGELRGEDRVIRKVREVLDEGKSE